MTEQFLARHPGWLDRYGEVARERCLEDARFHLDFLAAALDAGAVSVFVRYARWAARVLEARHIPVDHLAEHLRHLATIVGDGLDGADARRAEAFAEAGAAACHDTHDDEATPGDTALAPVRELFLRAILQGSRAAAAGLARETMRQGHAVLDVYVDVIEASLYEVGRLWEGNHITVADEHMATAVTQYVLAQLYVPAASAGRGRGRVVITGLEGEFHQVGAQIVADALESEGWAVRFLGANVPRRAIIDAIASYRPHVLGVSIMLVANFAAVRDLLVEVAALGSSAPRVVLGGGGCRWAPDAWKGLGVDGCAMSVKEAVGLFAQLGRAAE